MPNGKVVVFTGIMPIAKTEAGLAAVIGHEVGHVVAQHSAERLSQQLLTQLTLQMVDAALAASESKYRPIVGAAMGLGAQYGILLPFSREHESEADHIGLFYMAKAGYDPSEAIGLWERMEAKGGSGPWEFLSTHPSPETRRTQIQAWLPEAKLYYTDRTRPLPSSLEEVQVAVAAAQAEHARKVALAPMAARPSLQAGFWYSLKPSNRPSSITYRLDRVEACPTGECFVVIADSGGTGYYTTDYALVEIINPNGSWTRFSPPLRIVRWPLRVGDSWSETITIQQWQRLKQTTSVKVDVEDYEPVTVPAGSFMGFRIVVSLGGRPFRKTWYSPETRTFVRGIQYDWRGEQVIINELVDYQKSDEPAGGIRPE